VHSVEMKICAVVLRCRRGQILAVVKAVRQRVLRQSEKNEG